MEQIHKLPFFTTDVSCEKTVGEIKSCLRKYGRVSFLEDGEFNIIENLSFKLELSGKAISFKIPINIDAVYQILNNRRKRIKNEDKLREQAARVAWRIVKNWIVAQMAMYETGMVSLPELFFQYAIVNGDTIYGSFEKTGFNKLLTSGEL